MEVVNAEYTTSVLKEYNDNPLIEALPPILSIDQVIEAMIDMPEYASIEKTLSDEYRFHCIQRLLRFFQPLSQHLELERQISTVIRQGYLSRNPFHQNQAEFVQKSYEALKKGKVLDKLIDQVTKSAMGFTIIGYSGIGKTTGIQKVLNLYPKIIRHIKYKEEHFNMLQLPWVKLDCPFDGSLRVLCLDFFRSLDNVLGTDYVHKYGKNKNSIGKMLQHMCHLARLHQLGVLVIDEIQHLSAARSGGSEVMLNFFVTLVNTINIPVILIGTNKAVSILQKEFRQARRGEGQGKSVWTRLMPGSEWNYFMEGLWRYQWVRNEAKLTQEMLDCFYEESQGIIDIALKLFMLSQMLAIKNKSEIITEGTVRKVAKEDLKLLRPMINALKSGDPEKIVMYSDIAPIDMAELITNYKENIKAKEYEELLLKRKNKLINEQKNSLTEEVIFALNRLDIGEKVISNTLTELNKRGAFKSFNSKAELIKNAIDISINITNKKKSNNTKSNRVSEVGLITLYKKKKQSKTSVHHLLLEEKLIRNPLIQ